MSSLRVLGLQLGVVKVTVKLKEFNHFVVKVYSSINEYCKGGTVQGGISGRGGSLGQVSL